MKKFLKTINILLILAAIGLVLWLINKNFPANGHLEITAVLGQDRPMISSLGPPARVRLEDDYQIILDSPVYFDLRSIRWWKKAQIELVYQEVTRRLLGIGGSTAEEWQYDVKKPVTVIDLGNGWQKAIFYFDLNSIYQQKNIKRFLISSDGQIRDELKIKSIKIILRR